mmetsp:Transcript_10559/g.17710  ORF Transcript_10559/g.17710 Transcript_10559/m.17710 type:complete len:107 (+) Transcript_10559:788-1108(+)
MKAEEIHQLNQFSKGKIIRSGLRMQREQEQMGELEEYEDYDDHLGSKMSDEQLLKMIEQRNSALKSFKREELQRKRQLMGEFMRAQQMFSQEKMIFDKLDREGLSP